MSKEHYMHTCEVVDENTIVCQGMKFVKERTCKFVATSDCEFMDDSWIEKQCSCGEWIDVTRKHRPKYCPRCGARVVE